MKAGWKEVLLKDLIVLHDAKRIPLSGQQRALRKGPYPYHGATGVVDYVDDYLFDGDYILLGEDGSVITDKNKPVLQFVSGKIWVNNHAHVITASSKVDFRFLYYNLADLNIRPAVTGAVQMKVSQANLLALKTTLPPLPTQRRIAAVLGALDDKIELNRKMNANLEAQAQALFKSWFVDFEPFGGKMPKEWKMGVAQEFYDIKIGKTPPRKEQHLFSDKKDGNVTWLSIADMGNCGMFAFDSSEYLIPSAVADYNVCVALKGTVLLSFKLTVGRVAIATCDMATNEAIAHFKPLGNTPSSYTYLYLKNFNFEKLGSTSSIATAVNSKMVKSMPILMPTSGTLAEFSKIIDPMCRMIAANAAESRKLAETRDALLPKLMSGEVEVV